MKQPLGEAQETWKALLAGAVSILLAVIGFGIYKYSARSRGFNLQSMQIAPLTNNGKAERLAISPDEKQVLYTQIDHQGSNISVAENYR